jgi:chemotaxis protein methyltransferase CheR
MTESAQPGVPTLTQAEWLTFKDLVHRATGIALSASKKQLLVSRLMRRLKVLRLASFTEYYNRIANDLAGKELQALINSITTNKTEFFREPHHFELLESWLQSSEPGVQNSRQRGLRIWCAAASTGEEPYTIAAVVRSALSQSEWARTTIFATDVDTNALQTAKLGHYKVHSVENVSDYWLDRLFVTPARSRDDEYEVRPELKQHVHFGQLNLAKVGWRIPSPLDAIFCRNVLIYFDKRTQLDVVRRECKLLAPHGLLFLGHSEGLTGLELQLEPVAHTAYRARSCTVRSDCSSSPRLSVVSLCDVASSAPRPYVIGARGGVRLNLNSGVLVALFGFDVQQTCIAHLQGDNLTPALAAHIRSVLAGMARALREGGATESELQAKTIGVSSEDGDGQNEVGPLQAFVHDWLQQARILLLVSRDVSAHTELRVDMHTARIQIREPVRRVVAIASEGT